MRETDFGRRLAELAQGYPQFTKAHEAERLVRAAQEASIQAHSAIARALAPPAPPPEPKTARDAYARATAMLFSVFAIAAECDAKAEGLASAFMARKTKTGRRAAIACNMSALLGEIGTAEEMQREAKDCIRRWAESPGLPAPLVDLAPAVIASAADTLSLARARIKVACDLRAGDGPDMDVMGCMGAVASPDAEPGQRPETAAEREAREMAEMLS